jgi:hypothetical protein
MSGTIADPFNNSPPTDKDKNVLGLIFGDQNPKPNPAVKYVWYFVFAILATIIFWAFLSSKMNSKLKVVLFFLIILLLECLFNY